jgi:cytochrome c-type biogenesis protein CcmH
MESMIVFAFVAVAALGLVGWVAGRRTWPAALMAVSMICGVAAYAVTGRPAMPDKPFDSRVAEISNRMQSIDAGAGVAGLQQAGISGEEMLALLESAKRARPNDPQPHFFIGQMLANQGRTDEAGRAFQSALRRDPNFAPALMGLADLYLEMDGGAVSPEAEMLYARAATLMPSEVRPLIMIGTARLAAQDKKGATAIWDEMERRLPDGDPRLAMVAAMRERTADLPSTPPAAAASPLAAPEAP